MPELMDWTNLSFVAWGMMSFFHMPETETTSASPTRCTNSS